MSEEPCLRLLWCDYVVWCHKSDSGEEVHTDDEVYKAWWRAMDDLKYDVNRYRDIHGVLVFKLKDGRVFRSDEPL